MKVVAYEIAPFLPDQVIQPFHVSWSLSVNEAFITPARKSGFDVTNAQSYRPNSNLSVVSKLREPIVAHQFNYSTSPLVFCRVFSPTFDQATRQKLLFFAFCLISCRLSTLKMSLLWCRWICPLLLTLSIDHAILCRRLRLSFELDVHGMVLVIPS